MNGGGSIDGERRHVTVLFCDVVGSTQLSTTLDPEDLHEVIVGFQESCAAVVGRYEGHVAHYMGDAVLALFGYPHAHEDDAHQAVRSGLAMIEAVGALNARLERDQGIRLAVRVGIHTGLVIARRMGGGDPRQLDVVGETTNVAARLQTLAEPDTVLVSDATQRLIAGYFDSRSLGPRPLKGFPEPVPVHQVLHESGARTRLEVAATGELTPLVDREDERRELWAAWSQALGGRGRAVMLRGEPGIGKSRLVRELGEHVAKDPRAWLTPCQCSPYRQNTALFPLIDVIERAVLAFGPGDDQDARLRKVEGWVAQYGRPAAEAVPLMAGLLSLPIGDSYLPLQLTPELQKRATIELIVGMLVDRARLQPLLFVLEDVHWADPSTLGLLSLLIERSADSPMLVMLTARPGFRMPWAAPNLFEIGLGRLDAGLVASLAESVAGGKRLPAEIRDHIATKADGVPLFVEELTKTVLESGVLHETGAELELTRPLQTFAVPVTLEGSLLARLDRLEAGHGIAQVGAVLGRDFTHELIAALAHELGTDGEILEQGLEELVRAEILYEQAGPAGRSYVFKHALIRDAAYGSMLRARRRRCHAQAARVLEERFPSSRQTEPEVLAHHCTVAGLDEQALGYWKGAAQLAIERSGNIEAIAYIEEALELLYRVLDERERDRHELELRVMLGAALISTRGYASPDVEHTYSRARELSHRVGETPQLANIVWGLWVYYLTGGPLPAALESAGQYAALAARHPGDSGLAVETCQLQGIPLFYSGDSDQALAPLARGGEMYDRRRHHEHVFAHGGADTGVALMSHEALALWSLGRPDTARARMDEALELAHGLSHPFSLAFAHYYFAWLRRLCRDEAAALAAADTAVRICEEFGFPFWEYSSRVLRGTAEVYRSGVDAGLADAHDALTAFEATGGLLCRSALRGLLPTPIACAATPSGGSRLSRRRSRHCRAARSAGSSPSSPPAGRAAVAATGLLG